MNDFVNFIEDYTPVGVVINSFSDNKKETKNPLLKPEQFIVNEINPVKINSDGVSLKQPELFQDVKTIAQNIEKDVGIIADEFYKVEETVVEDAETIGKDAYKIGSSLFSLFEKVAIPMIEFMADNPKLIIIGTASYSGLLFYNQVKKALR